MHFHFLFVSEIFSAIIWILYGGYHVLYSILEFLLHTCICRNHSVCSPGLNRSFTGSISLSLCAVFSVNYSGISFNSLIVSSTVSDLEFILLERTSRMLLFTFRISNSLFFTSTVNCICFYFMTFSFYKSFPSLP